MRNHTLMRENGDCVVEGKGERRPTPLTLVKPQKASRETAAISNQNGPRTWTKYVVQCVPFLPATWRTSATKIRGKQNIVCSSRPLTLILHHHLAPKSRAPRTHPLPQIFLTVAWVCVCASTYLDFYRNSSSSPEGTVAALVSIRVSVCLLLLIVLLCTRDPKFINWLQVC